MKSMSFTVFSYNATVLLIQPNPTHGWTQPMSISAVKIFSAVFFCPQRSQRLVD